MCNNTNLHRARATKNDEFYTRYEDIAKELANYTRQFAGKVVYCNCDDPFTSRFFQYFQVHFKELKLKKLITSCYENTFNKGESPKALWSVFDGEHPLKIYELAGDGDFRSEECVRILKRADIVVSNPPFSLFRDYVNLLLQHNKKFLIVGPMNAVMYRNIFPQFKSGEMSFGLNPLKRFTVPAGAEVDGKGDPKTGEVLFGNIRWFTNLDTSRRYDIFSTGKRFSPSAYPCYENYQAVEVGKVRNIPDDYSGIMGVPLTFFESFNPEQFEVLGADESNGTGLSCGLWESGTDRHPLIDGQRKFKRVFIRRW